MRARTDGPEITIRFPYEVVGEEAVKQSFGSGSSHPGVIRQIPDRFW